MAADVLINIKANDQASGVLQGIAGTLGKIGAAAGVIGTAAIAGFTMMGKSALEATAEYEKLTLQIETLTAREIKNADSTLSMKDAYALAAPEAQKLLQWTQELAIKSPFNQETISNTLQQAMNYGFSAKQAQYWTQSLADMGAGMGWTADKMGLVSYAMGQINQSGTLMTQDLRQLMSAGVPVIDILDKMGYSLQDVATEAIDSKLFLEELGFMIEEDFPNAAERMTKSWAGMISTFDDIKKIGLRTLFEDTFNALQPLVGAFEDWLLGPGLVKIEEWGASMGNFTRNLIGFFSDAKNFDLSDLTGKFRDFMRGVDWQEFSDNVVAGINSIDWVAVGQEIRTSAANIWKGIKEAAEEIDWAAISESLGSALQDVTAGLYGYVDWESLKTDFNNGFASLFGYDTSLAFTNMQADFETGALAIGTPIVTAFESIKAAISVSINATLTKISQFKDSITNILSSITGTMSAIGKEWMTNLARGIKNGMAGVIAEVNKLIQQINNALGGIGFNIPLMGGVSAGGIGAAGGGSTGGGVTAPKPKPGQVEKFAGGGIATGSSSGYLAMLHGTEGVFTREQMAMLSPAGGGGITINLTYAPAFSTASADELEQKLMPLIQRGINQSRRNK